MTVDSPRQPAASPATEIANPRGVASVHLDALRGLAALAVVITHWQDCFFVGYSEVAHPSPLTTVLYYLSSLSHQWVIVFFVLSGYLVGGGVIRAHRTGRWSWRSYLLARLSRLYMVLLPALALGGLADWAGMHLPGAEVIYSGHSGVHALAFNASLGLTPGAFLGNALFLETILVPTFGTNGPLWSLVCEFWYYLAFPILVLLFSRSKRFWVRLASVAFLLLWCWFVGRRTVVLAIPWLLGVLLVYLPPLPERLRLTRKLLVVPAVLLFVAGMLVAQGPLAPGDLAFIPRLHPVLGRSWEFPLYDLLLGPVVLFLIWTLLHCAKSPVSSGYVWLAQHSARSSYTLYLIHLPVLIFLKALWHMPRVVPGWRALLVNMVPLLIAFLYAQLVYQLFEKNTDRVRNWLKPYVMGRKPPSPSHKDPEESQIAEASPTASFS